MAEEIEHPMPAWLTVEYFEPVLRRYTKEPSLRVKQLDCEAATGKGENYASVMTRFAVDYVVGAGGGAAASVKRDYFIVKATHEGNAFVTDLQRGYDVFKTEMLMYEKVMPQLSELLREEAQNEQKLFADTVHVDYEHTAIIFQDLAVCGFGMADRVAGLDMEVARMALKQLAKMHAAAAVLNERQGGTLERFDHGIFNRHTDAYAPIFEYIMEVAANFAGDCKELGAYYKDKLLKLRSRAMAYAVAVQEAPAGYFATLKHGDYWTNNFMLRYNEAPHDNGKKSAKARTIKDLIIIDLQFCAWGSPAVDLHYFFQTSLKTEVLLTAEDELVQYYHEVLAQTLRSLKYKGQVPSLHEICVQMEMGRFQAVMSSLVSRAILMNDKTDDADFEGLILDDERGRNFRKLLYQNEPMQILMKDLLPYFDRKGMLDVVD